MPRAVADSLFEHLIAAFPPDRAYDRTAFERPPMPTPVAHFLSQTLQRRFDLEVDQLCTARSDWFAYDHPDIEAAHKVLIVALLQHARVPQAEWERTLNRAVHLTTSYLVRPVQTLTEFVFEEAQAPVPAPVVYRRLGYFSAYPYLRAAVEAYFERKGVEAVDRPRFTALLTRVDRQMAEGYDADQWLRLLEPLLNLFRRTPDAGLPVALLRAFFVEKEVTKVVERIDEAARQGVTTLDEAGLRRVLTPPAAAPPITGPTAAPPIQAPPPDKMSASIPLWKKFMHEAAAPADHVEPAEAPEAGALPLWMQFRSPTDAQTTDLRSLERSILGEKAALDRSRFVTHLFSGSQEAYEQVLRRLYTAPTWTQASQIIAQDVFKAHQVNIYSAAAIAFTNAVEARYRQSDTRF